jgi:hypothetical protein
MTDSYHLKALQKHKCLGMINLMKFDKKIKIVAIFKDSI